MPVHNRAQAAKVRDCLVLNGLEMPEANKRFDYTVSEAVTSPISSPARYQSLVNPTRGCLGKAEIEKHVGDCESICGVIARPSEDLVQF